MKATIELCHTKCRDLHRHVVKIKRELINHVIGGGALNRADGFLYTYSASAVSLRVITVIFIRKKAIYSIYITYIKCINIYTDKRSQSTPQGVSAGPRLESPPAAAARYRLLRRSRAGRAGLRAGLLGVRSAPGDPPPLDPLRCGSLEATGPGAAPSTVLPPLPPPRNAEAGRPPRQHPPERPLRPSPPREPHLVRAQRGVAVVGAGLGPPRLRRASVLRSTFRSDS